MQNDFSDAFKELKQQLDYDDLGINEQDIGIPKIPEGDEAEVETAPPLPDLPPPKATQQQVNAGGFLAKTMTEVLGKPAEKPSLPSRDNPPPAPKEEPKPEIKPDVNTPVSNFSKEEKENVIAAFAVDGVFYKKFPLGKLLSVTLKTISDERQQILNEKLQRIEVIGDRRKHAVFYGGGTGEEYDTVYHVDAYRQKRTAILTEHLHRINDLVVEDSDEGREKAEKVLRKYPTNLLNAIYLKAMTPFLALVEEACRDIEVF